VYLKIVLAIFLKQKGQKPIWVESVYISLEREGKCGKGARCVSQEAVVT